MSNEFLYVNKISVQQRIQLQISRIGSLSAKPECICLCSGFSYNLLYSEKSDFMHFLPGDLPLDILFTCIY